MKLETILVDPRGRVTLPKKMLKALGIDPAEVKGYPITVELYPEAKPTCLIIKRKWTMI